MQVLKLPDADIGDDGARHIAHLDRLRELDLRNTRIGHEGLMALARLKKLETLDGRGLRIPASVWRRFHEQLPRCQVTRDP